MSNKKLLVVGPWLGEFGWLLMRWQGHIRHLSRGYDKTVVLHADNLIDRGRLFEDFAENVEAGYEYHGKVDMWNAEIDPRDHLLLPGCYSGYDCIDMIFPSEEICKMKRLPQEFINYGDKYDASNENAILFHARNVSQKQCGQDRNWPLENWKTLWHKVKESHPKTGIAFIGSKTGSLSLRGALDLRGVPLNFLIKTISKSRVLVGPSSGPHHLASLCGTHSIVWTFTEKWDLGFKIGTNIERYKTAWNPFNTTCDIIKTWQPSVDEVYETLKSVLV